MNWYIAKLVFGIRPLHKKTITEFDEQLRLVAAGDEYEALQKARRVGMREENEAGNVCWEFVDVAELQKLELREGAEISSSVRETDHPESYMRFVHEKAQRISKRMEPTHVTI